MCCIPKLYSLDQNAQFFQSWTVYSYTVAVTQCIGTVGTWVHIWKLPSLNPSWKWIILFFSFSLHKFRNSSIKYATTALAHTHLSSSFIIIIPISCLMMYKIVSWYSTKNNLTTIMLIILPLTHTPTINYNLCAW